MYYNSCYIFLAYLYIMKAVIKTGGKQYLVEKGDKINIEKIKGESGDDVTFENILLLDDDGDITIGTPIVIGAIVDASIIEQYKDKKKIIYKFKRRKRYSVKKGHRQQRTLIEIRDISAKEFKK